MQISECWPDIILLQFFKMKKTILFLFNGECFQMPPFMAILDSLCDEYDLKVLNVETPENRKRLMSLYEGKSVEFIGSCTPDISSAFLDRVRRKLIRTLPIKSTFYKKAVSIIESTSYDLLWVIHENTLCEFRDYLKGKEYITSIYELRDDRPDMRKKMKEPLQAAKEVMVAEYNRGCIFRVWFELTKTPTVIPNKPFYHPRKNNIKNPYSELLEGKNIILYQGGINEQRKLDVLCKAISNVPDWHLVLMGPHSAYRDKLQKEYPGIICIDFVAPPKHLEITSYAKIGIVKYDYTYLNHAYCAPNKIWEYSGFGIPILGNDLPGLEYTVGRYDAGLFVDTESVTAVEDAINKLVKNYDSYRANALKFYDSFDLKKTLTEVVQRNTQDR